MKRWIFLPRIFLKANVLCVIFIMAIFQSTLLDYFKVFGVKPDLILATLVTVSLYFDLKWALAQGVFLGILKDILGINKFGINTLLFPLWSFLIIRLSKKISLDNNLVRALLTFIILIFNAIIIRIFYLDRFIPSGIFLKVTFLESLYTALTLPLVIRLLKISLINQLSGEL